MRTLTDPTASGSPANSKSDHQTSECSYVRYGPIVAVQVDSGSVGLRGGGGGMLGEAVGLRVGGGGKLGEADGLRVGGMLGEAVGLRVGGMLGEMVGLRVDGKLGEMVVLVVLLGVMVDNVVLLGGPLSGTVFV